MYWLDSESRCLILIPVIFKSIVNIYIELNQSRIISSSTIGCLIMTHCITLNKYLNFTVSFAHETTLSNRYKIHLTTWTRTQKDTVALKEYFHTHTEHAVEACCHSSVIYAVIHAFCQKCCHSSSSFLFCRIYHREPHHCPDRRQQSYHTWF